MRGHGRCAPNSRLSTNEIISSRRCTSANPKRNAKVERSIDSFPCSSPPNLLWSLKRRLRTHDSALRYITVAPLDKTLLWREKHTHLHTHGLFPGWRYIWDKKQMPAFVCNFARLQYPFLWICLITLRALSLSLCEMNLIFIRSPST